MPLYVPKLVGDFRFPRYVIVQRRSGERRFWTGAGWSSRIQRARLYAEIDSVNRDIARLYSDLLRRSSQGDTGT